jgi:hypothetical protein
MRQIPFYANKKDNLHCFGACVKSALKYFFPKKNYTWKEINEITQKRPGFTPWSMAGLVYFAKHGIEIKIIDPFSYQKFANDGLNFLKKILGEKEFTKDFNADKKIFLQAEKSVKELVKNPKIKVIKKIATFKDIKKAFKNYDVVMVGVNAKMLYNQKGTTNHIVIILEIQKNNIILHDSGLPPHRAVKISLKNFKKAFLYNERVFALRRNRKKSI